MTEPVFLSGVPADAVSTALRRAPGNELASGKFTGAESADALMANAFGWFLTRPQALPPLPGVPMGRVETLDLMAELHFPWKGGRHPWLDVVMDTPTTLVAVDCTRYEPYRPLKTVAFTEPYAEKDWGPGMDGYTNLRRDLTAGRVQFQSLNAGQLVKHAYGLRHQALRRARGAALVYVYAEPANWASGKPVDPARIALHRAELARFADAVRGNDVAFAPLRWADLLAQWAATPALAAHAAAVKLKFGPL